MWSRRRRLLSGVVLSLAGLAAVITAALARLPRLPLWSGALIAGTAFAGGLALDPLKRLVTEWVERPNRQRGTLLYQVRMRDRKGGLLRVKDCWDAHALGVHRATRSRGVRPDLPEVPPYAERDADADPRLAEAFGGGGLVIIEGPSASGKTRMAFEAMHRLAAGRWLVVPDNPASLREMKSAGVPLHDAVVWLDDLERYIAAGGLDGGVLDALCPPGCSDVTVVATLRSEARRGLFAPSLETSVRQAARDVMRRARVIPLERDLTARERVRAAPLQACDERIATALNQHGEAGFAEYLAAGPAALDRWQSAQHGEHPVAAAIISAALSARRSGFLSPLPRQLLEEMHACYLDSRTAQRPERLTFDDGLAWAAEPVQGASSCLIPRGADSYEPFDYLVDHAHEVTGVPVTPSPVWPILLAHCSRSDLSSIAAAAHQAKRHDVSEDAFRRAAEAGDSTAVFNLGALLAEEGRSEEAQQWFRRAAQAGDHSAMGLLGRLLSQAGQAKEAERWFRQAAGAGDRTAMTSLGVLLAGEGRGEEAQRWFRRAAQAGDHTAMGHLGRLLRRAGRAKEAERWFRRAAQAGDQTAMTSLGALLAGEGRGEEAQQWFRQAAEAGDRTAMTSLGALLVQEGRSEEAQQWFRRAAQAGDRTAMSSLARLLRGSGQDKEARQWYRQAAEVGDPTAMSNLGLLLKEAGLTSEAEQWYRQAAEGGHTAAMVHLAQLLAENDREKEAEQWYRRAAEAGHAEAMISLGMLSLLSSVEGSAEAEKWWLKAANSGHPVAMFNLGLLLKEDGRVGEAEQWWLRAADAGHPGAILNLAQLLKETGREAESKELFLRAAHHVTR